MKLVPEDFKVPERLETPKFVIRKLMYSDAELDFEAVMSSMDIIHETRGLGQGWPNGDLTLEEDKIDLGWHQREFENRTSFAYTVFNLDNTECLGCLYLYPPGWRDESSKNGDVDVSFWVTQKAYDEGLYKELYETLDKWLKEVWPFKNIIYTNEKLPE